MAGAAAGANGKPKVEVLSLEEEKEVEEEESEEAQNMWQFVFSCGPVLVQMVSAVGAELVEAGACQYIALMLLPLWAAIKKALHIGVEVEPYDGIAPPPPPSQPPFHVVVQNAMWAYARENPLAYFGLCFGLAIIVGTYFLFLKDIAAYMDRRRAAQLRKERAQARGYASVAADEDIETGPPPEEDDEENTVILTTSDSRRS